MAGFSAVIGLGLGLCVGLIVGTGSGIAAGISMEKRRLGRRLGHLVMEHEWRVQSRDTGPVAPESVLSQLGLPPSEK